MIQFIHVSKRVKLICGEMDPLDTTVTGRDYAQARLFVLINEEVRVALCWKVYQAVSASVCMLYFNLKFPHTAWSAAKNLLNVTFWNSGFYSTVRNKMLSDDGCSKQLCDLLCNLTSQWPTNCRCSEDSFQRTLIEKALLWRPAPE